MLRHTIVLGSLITHMFVKLFAVMDEECAHDCARLSLSNAN